VLYKTPKILFLYTQPTTQGCIAECFRLVRVAVGSPKGCLLLMVFFCDILWKAGNPKVAQIFACGKTYYMERPIWIKEISKRVIPLKDLPFGGMNDINGMNDVPLNCFSRTPKK